MPISEFSASPPGWLIAARQLIPDDSLAVIVHSELVLKDGEKGTSIGIVGNCELLVMEVLLEKALTHVRKTAAARKGD